MSSENPNGRPIVGDESNTDSLSEVMEEAADVSNHRSLFGTSANAEEPIAAVGESTSPSEANAASVSILETAASGSVTSVVSRHGADSAVFMASGDIEELKREKVQLAQELLVLNEQHSALQSKCCKLSEKVETQRADFESMVKDQSQKMAVLRELKAERDRLVRAKNENEQKSEILSRRKQGYESRIERLTQQKSLLACDVESLKSETERLRAKGFLLQTQVDEVAKEKRMIEMSNR